MPESAVEGEGQKMNEEYRKELDNEQRDRYLMRIGLSTEVKEPTAEYLDEIVKAQLRTVPFDDADVWVTGKEPSLATDDLFDKIVTRQRGGYCFELNLLFHRLLRALGFDAYMVIIHLGRRGSGPEVGAPAHCGVIVKIDGQDYFADVGYGGPVPDGCVPLNGETVNGHFSYQNGVYTVVACHDNDGTLIPRFTFKNTPCDPMEIVPLNLYVARRENSGFAMDLKMNMRFDDGFAEIGGRRFRLNRGGEVIDREIVSPEDAKSLAREYFGVPDLPVREF